MSKLQEYILLSDTVSEKIPALFFEVNLKAVLSTLNETLFCGHQFYTSDAFEKKKTINTVEKSRNKREKHFNFIRLILCLVRSYYSAATSD